MSIDPAEHQLSGTFANALGARRRFQVLHLASPLLERAALAIEESPELLGALERRICRAIHLERRL